MHVLILTEIFNYPFFLTIKRFSNVCIFIRRIPFKTHFQYTNSYHFKTHHQLTGIRMYRRKVSENIRELQEFFFYFPFMQIHLAADGLLSIKI